MRPLCLALTLLAILFSTKGITQIQWQQTNGPLGIANGNVACMTLEPQYWILYAGTAGGGVLQTLDSGVTWKSVNNGLTDLNVQSLCGFYPQTVLAGTHSSGIFRTTDHGASWTQCISGLNNLNVAALDYDQLNTEFTGTANGLFKSTDGGIHWSAMTSPAVGGITALAVNQNNDIFMGDTGHVWRSTDHGASWTNVATWSGASSAIISVITIAGAGDVFVGDANNGIYHSLDNGANWGAANTGLANWQIRSIAVNYSTNLTCCTGATGGGGVYTTTDNGNSWQATPLVNIDASASEYAYGDLFVGTPTGIAKRQNGWSTFSTNGAVINSVAAGANGAAIASAKGIALFNTTNSGSSWTNPKTFGDTAVLTTFIASNGTCYCGLNGAGVYSSTDNGATWSTTGLPTYSIYSITEDRNGSIYCGSNGRGILKKPAVGNSWVVIDTAFVMNAAVTSMCVDSSGTVWAGTDNGAIICSTDYGLTWSGKNTGIGGYVNAMTSSPSGTTFAATAQGLYRTTDAGTTWNAATISVAAPYHALATNASGQIFVATATSGVYESTDDGITWASANTFLVPKNILSLSTDAAGFLFAGTFGGGVYRTTATTISGSTGSGPAAPIISIAVPGSDSATLVWNADHVSHIVAYLVFGGLTPAPTTLIDTLTDTTDVFTQLINDSTYYFRVKAVDDQGRTSAYSNEVSVTPAIGAAGEYKGDTKTAALYHGDKNGSDASGHENKATLHGVTIGAGRYGNAWSFDGSGAYAAIANSKSLNPTSQLTVELWFKMMPTNGEQFILGKGDGGSGHSQYGITVDGVFSGWISCNGLVRQLKGKTTVQANQWYHIAEVYNGSQFVLYVNGIEDARTSLTGAIDVTADSLWIGEPASLGQNILLNGSIDELRISSTARAASSLQLYLPSAVTEIATAITAPNISLHGIANPHGLPTKIYFEWDTSATMSNPTQTALQTIGEGNADTSVSAQIVATAPHTYYFRLVAVTTAGSTQGGIQFYSTTSDVSNAASMIPNAPAISKNYPNPFSTATTLSVTVPAEQLHRSVLKVYDVFGREVADITDQLQLNPQHVSISADKLPAGTYCCSLATPTGRIMRTVTVLK